MADRERIKALRAALGAVVDHAHAGASNEVIAGVASAAAVADMQAMPDTAVPPVYGVTVTGRFGMDLVRLVARDGDDVPLFLVPRPLAAWVAARVGEAVNRLLTDLGVVESHGCRPFPVAAETAPQWTVCNLGVLTATKPIGARVRLTVHHPGQENGATFEGTLMDLVPSPVSLAYYRIHLHEHDGSTVLDLPLSTPVEVSRG